MGNLKVGIVGVGSISHFHREGYEKMEGVDIVAVCDINEERVISYATEHKIPHYYVDYKEMFEKEDLDAISVCTWNNSHAEISISAMKHGLNVLCEKPLAMNQVEATEMEKVSRDTGKLLMVGFVRRFEVNANYIKETIENGKYGQIYYAKTGYIRKWGNPGGWFCDKKRSGGGPVIDLGVHVIDLVRYIVGKPKVVSVSASTFNHIGMLPNMKGVSKYDAVDYDKNNPHNDVEDAATALIKFDNGMTLNFETSWVLNTKDSNNYLNLYGDKAGVQMEPSLEIYNIVDDYYVTELPQINNEQNYMTNIFDEEIKNFIHTLEGIEECRNPVEDGVEVMKILDAIYESAETGKEVTIGC